VIITYYPVILAWCMSYFWFSLEGIFTNGGELPWASSVDTTKGKFLYEYANVWRGEDVKPWSLGSLSSGIVFSLVGVWILMFLCIFKGVKVVGKVVLWTVPLPWLMLMILTVNGLMQPGATKGLAYYLNPDWNQLLKPTTWRYAFGQVFFSMSLAFGVMVTYASFLHRKSDINNNAAIIGLGDLATSFIAGIAVFSTLGAMSVSAGTAVTEVVGKGTGTVGLSFIAFPYALGQLPHSAWFALVFFFALLLLGIDSAFSITESILASIVDKTGWNRTATLWGMSFVGLALGLVYCSRGGLAWVEDIDGFVNGPWGIALLGLLECAVLGWLFNLSRLRLHANERSDWKVGRWWDWNIRLFVPVVLTTLFAWDLYDKVSSPDFFFDGAGDLKTTSLAVLILAAAAPLLAVVLSLVRTASGGLLTPGGRSTALDRARLEPQLSRTGMYLALGAVATSIFTGVFTIATGYGHHSGAIASGLAWGLPMWLMIGVMVLGIGAALAATVIGVIEFARAERTALHPAWTARFSGLIGCLGTGFQLGMALSLIVLIQKIEPGKITEVDEMAGISWGIMAFMLALLVVGLGWCFYRALKAAGGDEEEPQLAEE
jgi:NSS family neurotransmitter:Na+ symporter